MEPDTDSEFVIVKVNSEILKTYEIEHKVNNILYTENKSKKIYLLQCLYPYATPMKRTILICVMFI